MLDLQTLSASSLQLLQSTMDSRIRTLNRALINHTYQQENFQKRKASQERRTSGLQAELQAAEVSLQNLIDGGADAEIIQEYQNERDLLIARRQIAVINAQQYTEAAQAMLEKEKDWYDQQLLSYQQFAEEIQLALNP